MANNKTHLTITTPTKVFYEGMVNIVTLKTPNGYIGLQANKSPFFSNIEIGNLYINSEKDKDFQRCAIGGGLVYADSQRVNIITDDIVYFKDIDLSRANRDKEWALEQMQIHQNSNSKFSLEIKLKKALSKIEAYNEINKK
ncbi:ATP synthase F1 subunit epsilon [Mycoplasma crocodyli]|uniref:ATP synthase epsilon chain n=1 Tax=Mycoplasma crocodyli (strain ATCC 51981 / MP145) TaxID=512564 RepID=D5E5F8_MYCCM|nr:ATP synthase F1 subunit epsilon [Mycoplasma crocodyli]ADE19433.1 ATP synthase F1, epsilon subunit [Mycoplasma crocodyli MP145]